MATMTRIALLLATIAGLAAPTVAAADQDGKTALATATAGMVPGAPVRCISLSGITATEIVDGTAIIYRVGSRMYVNRPRSGAARLERRDILLTRNVGTQLCDADRVRLVDPGSRAVRSQIVLGDFVPYTRAAAK